MRKIIFSMHTSIDGYAARINGEMDWIHVDEEMFDLVNEFTQNADTALYGRITYEMMEAYWPTAGDQPDASRHDKEHSAWYNRVNKVVLSRSLKDTDKKNTMVIHSDLEKNIRELKLRSGTNILIFGSPGAVHALLQLGLIDEMWLFQNPIVLGNGISFFKDATPAIFRLEEAKQFASGVIALHYVKSE